MQRSPANVGWKGRQAGADGTDSRARDMLTADPSAMGRPVTHLDLLAATRHAFGLGHARPRICLQARSYKREGPYWLCAELLSLGCSDAEYFHVQSAIDKWWARGRELRLCSPDGRCCCDDAIPKAKALADTRRSTGSATTDETQQRCGLQRGIEVDPTRQPT